MTMHRLLLLRHAKAERSEASTEDRVRKLIERGRKDATSIGAYMASHSLVPDRIIVSPSARTQETWKFAAAALRPAPAAISLEKLYNATPSAILGVIRDTPKTTRTLLVIGHNPGMHELALMLIASGDIETREQLREKLPTSSLVIVDFAVDSWGKVHSQSGRLERFVTPKSLGTAAR
jgi:phosphohistidine phosphatase